MSKRPDWNTPLKTTEDTDLSLSFHNCGLIGNSISVIFNKKKKNKKKKKKKKEKKNSGEWKIYVERKNLI